MQANRIPEPVREVCAALERAGFRSWVVGGCIRDLLMDRDVSDWDLATSALPTEVRSVFRRTIPTGIQHGTVTVMHRGEGYEVTTLRGDGDYTDGRRPDQVTLGVDIEEDLARRDFTVNAIAYDPMQDELVDPFDGMIDLQARLIRAVRDPVERFGEDGLRVLRAARFASTLGFELHEATRDAIPGSLETFSKVSMERVHQEWRKAFLKSDEPSRALRIMRETGILRVTCPPLSETGDELFDAAMRRLDRAPRDHELRLAALLLEVKVDGQARWVDGWLRAMRASNQERRNVSHLIAVGVGPQGWVLDPPNVRRWMSRVGRDALEAALTLLRADGRDVDALEPLVRAELSAGTPLASSELAINGKDVMQELDVAPSRAIGEVLAGLLDRVLEDPALGTRERLLAVLPAAYAEVTKGS